MKCEKCGHRESFNDIFNRGALNKFVCPKCNPPEPSLVVDELMTHATVDAVGSPGEDVSRSSENESARSQPLEFVISSAVKKAIASIAVSAVIVIGIPLFFYVRDCLRERESIRLLVEEFINENSRGAQRYEVFDLNLEGWCQIDAARPGMAVVRSKRSDDLFVLEFLSIVDKKSKNLAVKASQLNWDKSGIK